MASNLGLYRSYALLLAGALVPLWTGARSSVVMPKSAKRRLRKLEGEKESKEQDDDDDDEDQVERLSREDAYWFPVLGSVVLFSLFLAFKYLPKVWVNRILAGYMSVMAVAGLARTGVKLTKRVMGEEKWGKLSKYKLALTKDGQPEGHLSFTSMHLYLLPLAAILSGAQLYTNNWMLSNIVALSFSFNAVSLLYIDSFATGSVLLAGLFVYDVWWVFGSHRVFGGESVMVKVATSFDAPIKLLAPKDLSLTRPAADFSLLGLGDIVLPGIFIALALRFDYYMALKRAGERPLRPSEEYQKPYFQTVFAAYIAGLVATIVVMHTFRAAQPALLYLSPACVLSVVLLALVRGESKELWNYVDGGEDEEKAVKEGEEGKKEK